MVEHAKNSNGQYEMLEFRRGSEIPYIKGRRIRADDIYCLDYRSWRASPENIAKSRNLPLKVVNQSIAWCAKNDSLITRVLAEERKRAGLQ